jgi:hypothetical protein
MIPEQIHRCKFDDWELLECDCAGCILCGKIHECKDTVHCPVISEEGRHVCQITGFYTRRQVFSDDEFVETVGNISVAEAPLLKNVDFATVESCVKEFICSERTKNSLLQEQSKRNNRIKLSFIKLAKSSKQKKIPVNIMSIITSTIHETSNVRNPKILELVEAEILAEKCIQHINFFCAVFFENMKNVPAIMKIKGLIIGFLYLMRTGLTLYGNIEIVPKVSDLSLVLPSENHVKIVFKISTKVMTEVENFIKHSVKKLPRSKLLQMGFKTV